MQATVTNPAPACQACCARMMGVGEVPVGQIRTILFAQDLKILVLAKLILIHFNSMIGNLTQSGRDFNSSNAASLKGKLQSLEVIKELNFNKKTALK
jgi:hypothetical protein